MTVKELVKLTCYLDPNRDYNTEIIDGTLWVFFHASWSRQDWIRDFMCWPKKIAGFRFHSGYAKEYCDLESTLTEEVMDFIKTHKNPVIFAGYSRGSAVAIIAKMVFKYCLNERVKLILLGLPRVLYSKDCWIDTDDIIIQYGKDLVTNLPPWMVKINPTNIIVSSSVFPFKAIKDHGMYATCDDEIPEFPSVFSKLK